MNRSDALSRLQAKKRCDVLIIGGGVNGIATFRDLALQGIDVVLVEKSDYCSGASAASSHMVHGGIRYLENGEFRLVREAVEERNRLIKNAPHLVEPLATVIPIFKRLSGIFNAPLKFIGLLDRPSERGALVIKAGLTMYDAYTGGDGTVPRHRFIDRRRSLKEFPALNPEIINTAIYYDAAMPAPERICIDMLLDCYFSTPEAIAVNYVSANGADGETIELKDEIAGTEFAIEADLVINAAGPWIDFTNKSLGRSTRFMGGTKGSHLVLDHPELHEALQGNEFFFENSDGRIVLVYPLMNRVLIGTSDIKIDDPSDARCTEEEIDYFFNLVKRVFPGIKVDRSHIVFRFSGVRPLPASEANSTGQISRDHSNRIQEPDETVGVPVFNLIGGKWTTHRAFAEQVTDSSLDFLGRSRQTNTQKMPFGGGRDYPEDEVAKEKWLLDNHQQAEIPIEEMRRLFARYGTRAAEIANFIGAENDEPLKHQPDYSRREIMYISQNEGVERLEDLCLRRTMLGMLGYLNKPLLHELNGILGESLGWDAARQEEEFALTVAMLADKHGLELA